MAYGYHVSDTGSANKALRENGLQYRCLAKSHYRLFDMLADLHRLP